MPTTAVPSVVFVTVKLVPEIVAASMLSLKVAVICLLMGTLPSPAAGAVRITVGRVASASAEVVKLHAKLLARARPVMSFTAVVTVARHKVLGGNVCAGVKVATWVVAL